MRAQPRRRMPLACLRLVAGHGDQRKYAAPGFVSDVIRCNRQPAMEAADGVARSRDAVSANANQRDLAERSSHAGGPLTNARAEGAAQTARTASGSKSRWKLAGVESGRSPSISRSPELPPDTL
jgi:hypothetical protein